MMEYKGCNNCKYQQGPLIACDWLKIQTAMFNLKCPRWLPREQQEKPEMTTDEAIDLLRKGADRMARKAYIKPKEKKPEEKTEEKHAYWTWDEKRKLYVCSECGENPTDGTGIKLRLITLVNYYNFCRNCGAHMITDIIKQEQEEEHE